MSDRQAAQALLEKIIQIDAGGDAFEIGFILLLSRLEVVPVKAGIVEEVAFEPECLVIHLLPFGDGIHAYFHGVQLQRLRA